MSEPVSRVNKRVYKGVNEISREEKKSSSSLRVTRRTRNLKLYQLLQSIHSKVSKNCFVHHLFTICSPFCSPSISFSNGIVHHVHPFREIRRFYVHECARSHTQAHTPAQGGVGSKGEQIPVTPVRGIKNELLARIVNCESCDTAMATCLIRHGCEWHPSCEECASWWSDDRIYILYSR